MKLLLIKKVAILLAGFYCITGCTITGSLAGYILEPEIYASYESHESYGYSSSPAPARYPTREPYHDRHHVRETEKRHRYNDNYGYDRGRQVDKRYHSSGSTSLQRPSRNPH